METLWQDVRYGLRMLASRPGFTAIAVLTLALGIGANTAIFSVVHGVLLKPLPYPDADRITMVWLDNTRLQMPEDVTSYPNYVDWRDRNRSFAHLAGFDTRAATLTGADEPERVLGVATTANFFDVLEVQPLLGRLYGPEEETPGKDRVIVLSHGLWQRRFGGRRDILGEVMVLNGNPHEVIGVMPASFRFPAEAQLWFPLAPGERFRQARFAFWLAAIGRLRPGVTLEQARADMDGVAAQLRQEHAEMAGYGINLVPLEQQIVGEIRPLLLVLSAAVGFVLLIACANVANLLLARGSGRRREMAIRAALGASRGRLIRQMLTESLTVSLAGGAAGLLLAAWGVEVFLSLLPDGLPRAEEVAVNTVVLGFTFLLALLTGVVFGLLPALAGSRPRVNEMLKEGGRGTAGPARHGARNVLVVSEVALALVLLVGAGLMIRSFWHMQQVDRGFDARGVLTLTVSAMGQKYPGAAAVRGFFDRLLQEVSTLPGVNSAAATTGVFMADLPSSAGFTIEGKPQPPPAERIELPFDRVTPGYFETLRIPLLAGRTIGPQDHAQAPRVAVINETMARMFFPGEDPLGKRFKFGGPNSEDEWKTIVGVIRDVRRSALNRPVRPECYLSLAQFPSRTVMLVLRADGEPASLLSAVRSKLRDLDPEIPAYAVATLEERVAEFVARPRFSMLLMGAFGGIAVVLAAVGIYGVMAYAVSQRTHEIGVRMALGAEQSQVLRLVLAQGMALAGIGIVIGTAGAWAATQLIEQFLFGVTPTDPLTFAAVALILVAVALLACYLPARRATRVDPLLALRYE